MTEPMQTRIVTLAVVVAIAAAFAFSAYSLRALQARFAALAESMGSRVVREGKFLSLFPIEIEGRKLEVRYQHIGRGVGVGGWAPGWYIVTEIPLQGVSELHSADIRPRTRRPEIVDPADPDFEKYFPVRDLGYPLRVGWLNQRTRSAISSFYALDLPLEKLDIDAARLIHRSPLPPGRFDAASLRALLERQVAIASALEAAL